MRRLITLILVCAMSPALAQATVLRLATIAPDGSTWMREMRAGAGEIERRTEGRVRIQYFPGGVMGNEQAVLRRIRIGQLHGGAFTSGSLSAIHSDNLVYTLPFLFRSYDEVDYVRSRMDGVIERRLVRHGLVSLGMAEGGFAMLMSKAPISTLEDLRGKKVWVPEGDAVAYAAMRALGLSPVTLPMTDVLTALQTGLVDTVVTPPIGAIAFQWHTRITHVTDVPLAYTWAQLVVDARALRRLSDGDRRVVEEVMRETYGRLDEQNRVDNRQAYEALLSQGVEPVSVDRAELERWESLAGEVNRGMVEDGEIDRELYTELVSHLETYRRSAATADGG